MTDTVMDSCCLINLCAVGNLRMWLWKIGLSWHVPSAVTREALLLPSADGEGEPVKQRIELQVYISDGLLKLCDTSAGAETDLCVRLALDLDDGEAMALAIAKSRGWRLATDDRKARRLAGEQQVQTITTPELMRRWADGSSATKDDVRSALTRIEDLAHFSPGRSSPFYQWWREIVEGAP